MFQHFIAVLRDMLYLKTCVTRNLLCNFITEPAYPVPPGVYPALFVLTVIVYSLDDTWTDRVSKSGFNFRYFHAQVHFKNALFAFGGYIIDDVMVFRFF